MVVDLTVASHRIKCWTTLLVLGMTSLSVSRAQDARPEPEATPTYSCRWTDPVDSTSRRMDLPGACLVVGKAESSVRFTPRLKGKPCEVVSAAAKVTEALKVRVITSNQVEVFLPAATGIWRIDLVLLNRNSSPATRVTTAIWVSVPLKPILSKDTYGYLAIGKETLGYYRDPEKSGIDKVVRNAASYAPPLSFVQITPEIQDLWISPSIRLGELVVRRKDTAKSLSHPGDERTRKPETASPFPNPHTRLIPIRYDLLQAIEVLRKGLQTQGFPAESLKLISCFRTPRYNRYIGSGRYSRHQYGDAVDFVVDTDGNGRMNDVTGDGKVTREDGLWVVALIEELQADKHIPMGGIGVYTFRTGEHRLTLHLDLRGHRATWGYHHNSSGRKSEFEWESRRFAEYDAKQKAEREAKAKANAGNK